ncbi:M15 family metallopeptidase [Bacillaceae bacterium S4-13-56]
MKKALIFLLFLIILIGCQAQDKVFSFQTATNHRTSTFETKSTPIINDSKNEDNENESEDLAKQESDPSVVEVEDPSALDVVANKKRMLPADYVPENLVVPNVPFSFSGEDEKRYVREDTASALEELFAGASEEGIELVAVSGYRSYERQAVLYNHYVNTNGKEYADKFSAQPGKSEHQTGLSMDVSAAVVTYRLVQDFGNTTEGEWLKNNAHQYGFIIRYPEGKSHITGYSYEPWHIRYVGKEMAKEIYGQDVTLEEYLGYE